MTKAGRQQAELRVVAEDNNRHALITSVTVQGLDYYVVEKFRGRAVVRQSLHELGQSHTYVLGKRPIPAGMGKAMRAFKGIRSVWGSALSGLDLRDWTYVPKSDRPNRRLTLVVPIGDLPPLSSLEVWLMQNGRDAELLAEWQRRYDQIVATASVDWVEPQVAVVISAVTKRIVKGAIAAVHLHGSG